MLDPNKTIQFSIKDEREEEMRQTMLTVYNALKEKGYNPISQIVGYILSEDPTYITTHNNARSLIRRLDRDELLQALVKNYLNQAKINEVKVLAEKKEFLTYKGKPLVRQGNTIYYGDRRTTTL